MASSFNQPFRFRDGRLDGIVTHDRDYKYGFRDYEWTKGLAVKLGTIPPFGPLR